MADGGDGAGAMRLDRFLWFARFARTRSAAQAMASDGHLRITGRPATSRHAPVRVGDVLTFVRGPHIQVIRIEQLPRRRGPAPEARACYTDMVVANVSQQAPAD
uniref:RNA-binding S4 domain-containing protein n=1 Tax=Sphingomonas sp. TaxID=28214 RepID=UPI00356AC64C